MKYIRQLRVFWVLAIVLATALAVLATPQTAGAVNPTTISFQGKVVNSDGTNITDGTYGFTFKLYSAASGGTAIWGETQTSVTVTSGIFQVNLGSTCSLFTTQTCSGFTNTAIDFNANPALYLGITFNADPAGEMTPRPQLQSVPYAFNADKVGGLAVSQLVQLGPSVVQADASANSSLFINKTGTGDILQLQKNAVNVLVLDTNGNLTVSGTYNGDTLTSSSFAFSAASANTISGTSNQNLTLQTLGTGQLTLGTGTTGILGLASSVSTIQRTAVGTTTLDLNDTANTSLVIKNSGAGVANLDLFGGDLQTGSTPVTRLDNAGNLTNIGNYTATGSLSAGYFNDSVTDTTGTTFTVANVATGYNLKADSTTTNTNLTSTFNITGLPAADGTLAIIHASCAKGITSGTRAHTCIMQIAGTTLSTVATVTGTAAATTTRAFTVMRMGGVWTVVGAALTATPTTTTSTVNTADYAEWIHYSGDTQPQPGDVLSVGADPISASRSSGAYDGRVIGVVSTSPYEVAGADDGHSVVLALTGRVPVTVSLENGPIAIGDKLAASSVPGVAMKATQAGYVVGTALSAYDGSQAASQVMTQLAVGYFSPAASQGIISPSLLSSGALVSDSGAIAPVAIDPAPKSAYNPANAVSNPPAPAAKTTSDTAAVQGLVINQVASFHDTSSTHTSTVSTIPEKTTTTSTTDSTQGTFVSHDGGMQLLDAHGANLFTIDSAGNSVLAGSLNLTSATISGGLTVGGDVNVAGLSTFQKLATFLAKTIFRQNVQFDGHITVSSDTAGYASLRPTESKVHVTFAAAYDSPPIVSVNAADGQYTQPVASNISTTGFDITVAAPVTKDTKFSWTAIGASNAQTATNPLPATTP